MAFPKSLGGLPDRLAEDLAEVSLIFEADHPGNFGNRTGGAAQQALGLQNAVAGQIVPGRDFQFAVENAGQVVFADADGFRDFPAGERPGVILMLVGHGAFDQGCQGFGLRSDALALEGDLGMMFEAFDIFQAEQFAAQDDDRHRAQTRISAHPVEHVCAT